MNSVLKRFVERGWIMLTNINLRKLSYVQFFFFQRIMKTSKYEDVEVASIYCHNLSSPKGTKLAEYSSKEKAETAMEMLHITYKGNKVEEVYQEGTNYYHPTFQFPADEDVKV